jgi:hypothetical protein
VVAQEKILGFFYFINRKILYKVVGFGKNGIYIKNGGLCE